YEVLDDDCPWALNHEPVYIGGTKCYALPCEPLDRRLRRQLKAGEFNGDADEQPNKSPVKDA
ncbi:MAG: hypothetical protein JWN70_683, partial [Planctomycetaceae bacterium]|nr:hypothetical protein [Planctomycetaceae bacterium]